MDSIKEDTDPGKGTKESGTTDKELAAFKKAATKGISWLKF